MKKKLLAFVLALSCTVGAFSVATTVDQPVAAEAATKKKAPSLTKVYSAVKKAYGDDYLPDVRLKKNQIKEIFGVSDSWYTGVIAETRMINIQAEETESEIKSLSKRIERLYGAEIPLWYNVF